MVLAVNQKARPGVDTKARTTAASSYGRGSMALSVFLVMLIATAAIAFNAITIQARADNFTDIFYTNSFRGAFTWVQKLDWVGMLVQIVISCFSLFGVALLVIRIMTSMLYLSAKGMWEEVHDLKQGGESQDKDLFGMIGMAKSWVKGKAGTGLDAIIGAVLMLLPDVKKYSDFGEKASGDFSDDMNIGQYMLKILLPTILTVFFFAMGFNGTLFQFLAVTVDFMGSFADKAISVNYAGYVDDLINSGTGYKFAFSATGTEEGKFKQELAKDLYGRAVSGWGDLNANQLSIIGQYIEGELDNINADWLQDSTRISEKVRSGLASGGGDDGASVADKYWSYLGYDIIANSSETAIEGSYDIRLSEIAAAAGLTLAVSEDSAVDTIYHIFPKQTTDFNGSYFNLQ